MSTLPVAFRTSALKKHREKVLFDREKARLPLHMDDARRYKAAKEQSAPLRAHLAGLRAAYEAIPVVAARIAAKQARADAQSAWFRGSLDRLEYELARREYHAANRAFLRDRDAQRLKHEIRAAKRPLTGFSHYITTFGTVAFGAAANAAAGGAGVGAGAEASGTAAGAAPAASPAPTGTIFILK